MSARGETPVQSPDRPIPERRPARSRLGLFVVVLGCLVMVAMWSYYLLAADTEGVYQLRDDSWAAAARPVCAAAQSDRAALTDDSGGFITDPTIEQMRRRADVVDRATDILERMLDDIVAIPVDNDRDRAVIEVFDDHYRMVIDDRRRYAASLRAGDDVPYTETVAAGGPVSNVVTDFTAGVKGNAVPECSPPRELGQQRAP